MDAKAVARSYPPQREGGSAFPLQPDPSRIENPSDAAYPSGSIRGLWAELVVWSRIVPWEVFAVLCRLGRGLSGHLPYLAEVHSPKKGAEHYNRCRQVEDCVGRHLAPPELRLRSVEPVLFTSRRRHTRYIGDWSSDVCSSD